MKIIIRSDNEDVDDIVLENVLQFSICGSLVRQGVIKEPFRRSMISDHNELIGLLKATELDILDHKEGVTDVDTNKR